MVESADTPDSKSGAFGHEGSSPSLGTAPALALRSGRRSYTAVMSRSLVERRLSEVAEQLKSLRRDLAVADEQLGHFADEADDARLRALVSETPLAQQEHRSAQKHADAMRRHRAEVVAEIERLEVTQDELLDRLLEG